MADETHISLRDRLRRETATAHDRVDSLFGACDFGTEEGYGAFLSAQSTAWETLRPILDPGSLARADALRRDLAELGLPTPQPIAGTPLPDSASLGHRYVLEGSRLGSILLHRTLLEKSPELAERASAYLRESANISAWKQLSTKLQIDSGEHDRSDQLVDDARFVFGLFENSWRVTEPAAVEVD